MRVRKFGIISATICLLQFACTDSSNVVLSIKAKSAEGFPIANATVLMDDKTIGQTNGFGTFSTSVTIKGGTRHKISITKDDEKYYFAPHVETFTAEKGEEKSIAVDAMMYTVPKPKVTKKTLSSSAGELKKIEQPKADSGPANMSPEPLPLIPLKKLPRGHNNVARSKISEKSAIFTTHVYAGRFPLDKASVTFIDRDGNSVNCQSNDRGRCVLESSNELPVEGYFIIQKNGYRTITTKSTAKENSNFRFSMETGSRLDIRASVTGHFTSKPADNVSVRIKNQNSTENPIATDSSGFLTLPIQAKFPLEIELTHVPSGVVQKRLIQDSNGLRLEVNFSDASTAGWNQWFRCPIHLSPDALSESGLVDFERLDGTLQTRLKNTSIFDEPLDFETLPADGIALLPIVRKDNQGLSLGIIALTRKGKIAESIFTHFPLSSVTEEQWLTAFDAAAKNINSKLPWPGTVMAIKNRELEIAINSDFIDRSDRISVDTVNGPMSASITKTGRKSIRATLDAASHLSTTDLINLIGSKAQKIVHSATSRHDLPPIDLPSLISIKTEHRGRRMARKYLAENNEDQALTALLSSIDAENPSLEDLEMAAWIDNKRGKTDGALSSLKKMASAAAKLGHSEALPIIETNIQLLQIETLPAIAGDETLAKRFEEIASKAKELRADLSDESGQSSQSIALSYIILTAQQKAAESRDDVMTLATMSEAWGNFEKILGSTAEPSLSTWRTYAARQKDRSSLGSASDKSSL